MKSKKTSIEYQFIGYKDFGRLTYDSQSSTEYQDYLPEAVKDKVLSDKTISKDSSSNVILVEVNENQYWVVYVSERLDLVQTCKLLLITLMRSLEEYKAIKALEPEVKQEVVVKSENIQDEQQLSDQIQEFENQLNKLKFSEKLLIKSLAKSGKLSQCQKAIDILEEKLKLAKETVNQVVLKAEDQKTETAKNLFQRFINMPEIKGMLAEINNGSGECEGVKANLLKRMEHVLINSEWVEDNLPICEYLVTSLFPDLRSVFDVKHKEPQHETVAGQFLAGLLA